MGEIVNLLDNFLNQLASSVEDKDQILSLWVPFRKLILQNPSDTKKIEEYLESLQQITLKKAEKSSTESFKKPPLIKITPEITDPKFDSNPTRKDSSLLTQPDQYKTADSFDSDRRLETRSDTGSTSSLIQPKESHKRVESYVIDLQPSDSGKNIKSAEPEKPVEKKEETVVNPPDRDATPKKIKTSMTNSNQNLMARGSFRSGTDEYYKATPSLDFLSEILNKPYYLISNYTSYTDLVVMEFSEAENTFFQSMGICFLVSLLKDSMSSLSLTTLIDKVSQKFQNVLKKSNEQSYFHLTKGLRDLIDEKITKAGKEQVIHTTFFDKFGGEKDFRDGLISLIKEMLIDFMSNLEEKAFRAVFKGEKDSLENLNQFIRAGDGEPIEAMISLLPSILGYQLEIHYVKEKKIEIVAYNSRSNRSKQTELFSLLAVEKQGKLRFWPLLNQKNITALHRYLNEDDRKEKLFDLKLLRDAKSYNVNILDEVKSQSNRESASKSSNRESASKITRERERERDNSAKGSRNNSSSKGATKLSATKKVEDKAGDEISVFDPEPEAEKPKFDVTKLLQKSKNFNEFFTKRTFELSTTFFPPKKIVTTTATTLNAIPSSKISTKTDTLSKGLPPSTKIFESTKAPTPTLSYNTHSNPSLLSKELTSAYTRVDYLSSTPSYIGSGTTASLNYKPSTALSSKNYLTPATSNYSYTSSLKSQPEIKVTAPISPSSKRIWNEKLKENYELQPGKIRSPLKKVAMYTQQHKDSVFATVDKEASSLDAGYKGLGRMNTKLIMEDNKI